MKVIFLDVDGVLNSMPRTYAEKRQPRLQPEYVQLLKELVEATDAKICVSSTWRLGSGYIKLVLHLCSVYGFDRRTFVGKTPDHRGIIGGLVVSDRRGQEIQQWLRSHPQVRDFVILDDDADMGELLPRLVQTDHGVGLTRDHVDRAIQMLNATEVV